jgi:3D (Asp-Asp-Asp) domain-containing protein
MRSLRYVVAIGALLFAQNCARNRRPRPPVPPAAAKSVSFTITAYCLTGTTASGTRVAPGIVAADPNVLPLGTVIRLAGLNRRYNGTYTVMDTGARIRGRRLDLYVPDCAEAVRFGRRSGHVFAVR